MGRLFPQENSPRIMDKVVIATNDIMSTKAQPRSKDFRPRILSLPPSQTVNQMKNIEDAQPIQ